jgi:hypothetical protein
MSGDQERREHITGNHERKRVLGRINRTQNLSGKKISYTRIDVHIRFE